MTSILDPSFKYVNSFATDIRKTFARVRRERERQARMAATGSRECVPEMQRQHLLAMAQTRG